MPTHYNSSMPSTKKNKPRAKPKNKTVPKKGSAAMKQKMVRLRAMKKK